jgi:hypothetical protein
MWLSSWLGKRQRSAPRGRRHASPRKRSSYRPRLEVLEDRWLPSQIGLTVTSLADSGPGTLRAAIQTADAGSHSDKFTISFAVSGTIDLQSPLPALTNNIAIQGPGGSSLTVERAAGASFSSANDFGSIFFIGSGQTASLSGLTIANGTTWGIYNNGGTVSVSNCTVSGNSAGGISTFGTLTISNSTISGNSDSSLGGGIANAVGSTLTVSGCTISGNSCGGDGGGIFNEGQLTVTDSTLSGNSAGFEGGGIWSTGSLTVSGTNIVGNAGTVEGGGIFNANAFGGPATIIGSTLSGNSATYGGGIANESTNNGFPATLTVSGSTLISNSASYGGGIYNFGATLTVANSSTVSGNSATYGGGIYNEAFLIGALPGSVTLRDSVLTGNLATDGGAIYNVAGATLVAQNSTFSGNSASDSGGGVYNLATATLQQSTLSGNTAASDGGGVFNGASGTLAVKDSTVLKNVAALGADIYNLGALTQDDSTVGVVGP